MKCPTCDATIESGVAFCPHCGTRIDLLPNHSAAEGQTILLRDVPLETSRGTQPLDALPPTPTAPVYAPPPYTPPVTPSQQYAPTPAPQYVPSQGYAPYPSVGVPMQVASPTSTAAIISLVFGILSWSFLPVISPFVAVVAGHMARREIRDGQGRTGGSGLALVGLILGYLALVVLFFFCVIFGISALSSR